MKTKALLSMIIIAFAVANGISPCIAQSKPVFVQLGQAKGAVYKPDSGPVSKIGLLVMHREANYMNNIACREFSRRGLCGSLHELTIRKQ